MSPTVEVIPYLRCHECRRVLPLDPEHFHRHCRHPDGFRSICRNCRSSIRKAGTEKRRNAAIRTGVLAFAKAIRQKRITCGDEICENAVAAFRGPEGIVQAMRDVFERARPGSPAQANIILAVGKAMLELSERNERREAESSAQLNRMSPEQLRAKAEWIKAMLACHIHRNQVGGMRAEAGDDEGSSSDDGGGDL